MVTRLADGVWWFDLRGVNAYLIDEAVAGDGAGSGVTLVDAGLPWHGSRLVEGIAEAGYELADIERILVTHYDVDHVGGLAGLDGLDAPIYVGEADAELVAGRRRPPWHNHKGLFQRAMAGFVSPPENPVEQVTDGDTVGTFTVYATPGHTPGHIAYVSEAASVGLLGDLVRESGGSLQPSPWLLSYATDEVARSIADLDGRAPAFEVLGVGHGRPFERDGRDRLAEVANRR
ncbi:MBL fold metallo-hydrolase [Halomicrobium mukohataei]|uniref:MBL fold metallo-hydrolase n=1 Tax=Halomicrobium mukohataei TaxID=57705 RepID=A0A847U9N0_9EURY|nr:MBL fold metallo-hydrolase [Halomicrobium mukohataei]NLV09729.1 MBL fold metallo-hydrolase [Halomicrobium mukohataei]